MFSRKEEIHSVADRVSSIEAWLNDQPDPYADADPTHGISSASSRKTSRRHSERPRPNEEKSRKREEEVDVEQKRPERKAGSDVTRTRRRRSRNSVERPAAGTARTVEASQEPASASHPSSGLEEKERVSGPHKQTDLRRRDRASRQRRVSAKNSKTTVDEHAPRARRNSPSSLTDSKSRRPRPERQPPEARSGHTEKSPATALRALSTIPSVDSYESHSDKENAMEPTKEHEKSLERRLTTHEDLMSVLSSSRPRGSTKSARSVRTAKTRISTASLSEVLGELDMEEKRYMRELKTLVDGVIPVLLQCVLSKSDSTAAVGLFATSGSARDDLNFTKPIIDMGVALERLKSLHRRIPTQNLPALLAWAQGAHKVYVEYLKAWRLGFQDVIVNLAPPDDQDQNAVNEGMERDGDGDIINGKGEKVDVAYLLKRPLVRIKSLSKLFAHVQALKPSQKASAVADQYADLIKAARQRSHEEQSRLEDEAAANLDTTKVRDLHSLAVLVGVQLDKDRRVKARDCFSLTVQHSSGQRLDCQVELLLRDSAENNGGDLLICEVEKNGTWLLFPPFESKSLSARYGDEDGELVVMIRSATEDSSQVYELLSLKTNDIEAASEWLNMLGSDPFPPKLAPVASFISPQKATTGCSAKRSKAPQPASPPHSSTPEAADLEIPLGEPSMLNEEVQEGHARLSNQRRQQRPASTQLPVKRSPPISSTRLSGQKNPETPASTPDTAELPTPRRDPQTHSPKPPLTPPAPTLQRSRLAKKKPLRPSQSASSSPTSPAAFSEPAKPASASLAQTVRQNFEAARGASSPIQPFRLVSTSPNISESFGVATEASTSKSARPGYQRTKTNTPSDSLPLIPRLRPSAPAHTRPSESIRDRWSASLKENKSPEPPKTSPTQLSSSERDAYYSPSRERSTGPTPVAEEGKRNDSPSLSAASSESPPIPPPHRLVKQRDLVQSASNLNQQSPVTPNKSQREERRPSSPLKHQYAPSSASSDESSDSEESIDSSSSETSEDCMDESDQDEDDLPSIPPVRAANLKETAAMVSPASLPNLPAETLAPSNSASQAPYRTVPHLARQTDAPTARKIATVCAWSDKGIWESLHPEECSIVITPGLIEAYEMSAEHSQEGPTDDEQPRRYGSLGEEGEDSRTQPLIGFELTPLVPLRRGTALDISIRSPPTSDSKIKTNANIMFRSRNAQECEELYAMINFARINNPTWIALERARPKNDHTVHFDEGRGGARHSWAGSKYASWFGFGGPSRKSSYRAKTKPRSGSASIAGVSESSVGSMSSALSALRRFSVAGDDAKKRFNLNRSSVLRKQNRFGSGASNSLYSSSSETTQTGDVVSPQLSQVGLPQIGNDPGATAASTMPPGTVNNVKVRLYVRESAARWRNLGPARLCIMSAAPAVSTGADDAIAQPAFDDTPFATSGAVDETSLGPSTTSLRSPPSAALSGQNPSPNFIKPDHQRILLTGKNASRNSLPLLDVTLHESCFERVARTGIAISVWEERTEVAKVGGVVGGKTTMYMMQMKGEAEASWIFGLVGRLRY